MGGANPPCLGPARPIKKQKTKQKARLGYGSVKKVYY